MVNRMKLISITSAKDGIHKYVALVIDNNEREHHIKFGLKDASDYLHHKDEERRDRYINRHRKREDWTSSGRLTAGFWSKHLLWGDNTSLEKNIAEVRNKYFD